MWPQPAGRPLLTPSRHSAQETPRLSISTQVILGVLIEYCDTAETVYRWHIGATATRLDNMLPDTGICSVLGLGFKQIMLYIAELMEISITKQVGQQV